MHLRLKSNPENVTVATYMGNDNRLRTYIFPEGRELTNEECLEMAAVLYSIGTGTVKRKSMLKAKLVPRFRDKQFLDFKQKVLQNIRRFETWAAKNES